MKDLDVIPPIANAGPSAFTELFEAAAEWRRLNGQWPRAFVSDITTTAADARADAMLRCISDCGFEIHRHREIDDVDAMVEGFRATEASLVLICARGSSNPDLVRPFVLAIPDADYILVVGDEPDPTSVREGDPGSRGFYVDPLRNDAGLDYTMRFIMRGLGTFTDRQA